MDKCFVATEDTARRARSMGLQDSQIVVHGLPIRPAFARKQPSKKTLRGKLGAYVHCWKAVLTADCRRPLADLTG